MIGISDDDTHDDEDDNSEDTLNNHSAFKMLLAMVNPQNPEGGREFLQITNVSDAPASLNGWKLTAPNGKTFTFSNIDVLPGEVFKFIVPSSEGVLRNKEGKIKLTAADGTVAHSVTYTTEQARREGRPILF